MFYMGLQQHTLSQTEFVGFFKWIRCLVQIRLIHATSAVLVWCVCVCVCVCICVCVCASVRKCARDKASERGRYIHTYACMTHAVRSRWPLERSHAEWTGELSHLQWKRDCNTLQHTATHCNTPQHKIACRINWRILTFTVEIWMGTDDNWCSHWCIRWSIR